MARPWLAAVVAVAAVAALASGATAAPRAACRDPRGDVRLTDAGPVVDAAHLDLLDADVAVGARELTVVIGTYGMGGDGVWRAEFAVGRTAFYAVASNAAAGNPLDPDTRPGYRGGIVGGPAVEGVGVFDAAKREIRISLPTKQFGSRAPRRGARLAALSVVAKQKLATTGAADVSLVDRHSCG